MSICQIKPVSPMVATQVSLTPSSMPSGAPVVSVLESPHDLVELLEWYYGQKSSVDNPFVMESSYFPWLHNLATPQQRQFFTGSSTTEVVTPLVFNLITVNCVSSGPCLINSVHLDTLLAPVDSLSRDQPINNRNFGHQLSLMAANSSLLLFGSDKSHLYQCSQQLRAVMETGTILLAVIPVSSWADIPKHLKEPVVNTKWLPTPIVGDMVVSDVVNPRCPLLAYEHAVLFSVHGRRRLFDNLFIGTTHDFDGVNKSDYKLIIQCHDSVSDTPPHATLLSIYNDWNNRNRHTHYYLEFPSGGYTPCTGPSFINTLRIILSLVQAKKSVYLFSFDGFTGVSVLMVALAKIVWKTSLEDTLLRFASMNIKSYLFKGDFSYLKQLDPYLEQVDWEYPLDKLKDALPIISKRVKPPVVIPQPMALKPDQPILHPLEERGKQANQRQATLPQIPEVYDTPTEGLDWFQPGTDVNFPASIIPNELYLGSWLHASSKAVLQTLGIERIISVGDCPSWCQSEVSENRYSVLWRYENITVVEVDCTQLKTAPFSVKSVIFIHNFNDDGRDSLLPLLFHSPPELRAMMGLSNEGASRPRPPPSPKTLVHCRIGVSRSASLVIASLMVRYNISLVAAYLYVRVQRFNIIIQPNLRLMYSLWLWEKQLHGSIMPWEYWAQCVDSLNRHYLD